MVLFIAHSAIFLVSEFRSRPNSHGTASALTQRMSRPKQTVYIIRSNTDPSRHYTGLTSDVEARLEWHNHGPNGSTIAGRPWSLVVKIELPTERLARRFEQYLKSGSGRAFVKRHFAGNS
jgi:predicted GIY-YIG superfamily endonuclease